MKIAGLQKNSTIDFPGKLSCVVFVSGCNYDCYFCHNRHLLDAEAKVLEEEVFNFLEKRRGLIDGVVITGGEPSLYDDLPCFIAKAKSLGFSIKLDTNGSNPDLIKKLTANDSVDFIAVDYKVPFNKYALIGACDNVEENEINIEKTIKIIMDSEIDYEIRTTVIPEITKSDILDMSRRFPPFNSYVLQKYRPVPEDTANNEDFYSAVDIRQFADMIKPYQPNVIVRA